MEGAYRAGGVDRKGLREIESEYGNCLCSVYSTGYSVVEITRLIGCRKAVSVYRILQRRGVIDSSLKRSRFRGPSELENALQRTGMSFAQWCNSWRFDPKSAQEELLKIDTSSGSGIHQAAQRDFPGVYSKNKGSIDLEEWEIEVASHGIVHSFRVDWDQRLERFVGTIPGIESLSVAGTHPSVVMSDLVRAGWLLKAITILNGVGKKGAKGTCGFSGFSVSIDGTL
jgi:hypothetical protein